MTELGLSARAIELALRIQEAERRDQLSVYRPYDFQVKAHNAVDRVGNLAKQVLLMAANQIGKTYFGARHDAINLTGRYPDWWSGWRNERAVRMWVGGVSNDTTRDILQAA